MALYGAHGLLYTHSACVGHPHDASRSHAHVFRRHHKTTDISKVSSGRPRPRVRQPGEAFFGPLPGKEPYVLGHLEAYRRGKPVNLALDTDAAALLKTLTANGKGYGALVSELIR